MAYDDPITGNEPGLQGYNRRFKATFSTELEKRICEALGIDWKGTYRVTIYLAADEPSTVTIEQYIHRDDMKALVDLPWKAHLRLLGSEDDEE